MEGPCAGVTGRAGRAMLPGMAPTHALAPIAGMLLALACGGEPRGTRRAPLAAPSVVTAPSTLGSSVVLRREPSASPTASAAAAPGVVPGPLESAPRLVYRSLETGALSTRSTLRTRTLQRFEDQALLTVATQLSESDTSQPVLGPFDSPRIRRYLGRAKAQGDWVSFTLSDGEESVTLECTMGEVKVARATAVRTRAGRGQCAGDRGRWLPGSTTRVRALRCGRYEPAPDLDREEDMAFTAAPGIEFLFVNDDCVMQGGGYRFIPEDGSVGAIRAPHVL